ncbi:MAG TPA: M1 family aminopeptidase, partial [Pyrinomonadaceae bacterium]|nr:M1 family aminopeptidase [Pyrinomonadaceae bacterium]
SAPDVIAHQQVTVRQTKPFPPTQYVPDHDFDTKHIALDLRFDWQKEQLVGRETLVFSPLVSNLKTIKLDAANITPTVIKLTSIRSQSESLPGTQTRSSLPLPVLTFITDAAKEKVNVTLDRAYQPADELTLTIDYHTNGPQDPGRLGLVGVGLKFLKPGPDDPSRPRQIWSQGESEYNHYWFLCYDHPNDFFTSEITAIVDKPLQVISNGRLVETKENKDGSRTFHWKIDQPHASYLTSIVVGEYIAVVSDYAGIPITTYAYPKEVAEAKLTVARLPEMVKFFSEKTGIKYPYAKYAQTTAHDFGGGMENISATTQTDSMIHDARTELDQTSDGLQSHELAHQWFGDYVTCRDWSDIWLNESFATYFQAMWDEHKLGSDNFLYSDIKANQDSYFTAWKLGTRRPIVTKNYKDPDAVFDTYAYPRGGAVLHMLRKNLGEDNWWRAINYYLKKYANQPVETEQFRIAIEEATGQSMDWFFDEWLYRMGHPVFEVTQHYDAASKSLQLTVRQKQVKDPDSQYPQAEFFQTPVEIEIGTATQTRIERVIIEPKKEQTFTFKVDSAPLLVNFDYKSTLIKELEFKKSVSELSYQLERDEDVLGRVWALNQLATLWKLPTTPTTDKAAIADALAKIITADKFWAVRFEAATALADVSSPNGRTALLRATKDQNAKVRAKAITSLAASKDATLAPVYQQLLSDQSYGVIKAAALALGQTKAPGAFEALAGLLDAPSWRNTVRVSALAGLSALADKRAVDVAIKFTAQGDYPQVRVAAAKLLGIVGKDDPRAFSVVSNTLEEAVKHSNSALVSALGESLVRIGDARGVELLERLTKDGTNSRYAASLAQFQAQLKKSLATTEKTRL